jgi:fermentation-respiration switch protein FrsA (DUF1100 family)
VPTPGDDGGREPHSLDEWLRQFLSDGGLMPVALVAAGCFTAIGAGIVLAALRARNLPAGAALVLLAAMSIDALLRDRRRHGQLGLASRLVLALWVLSAAAAAAALALGLA